MNRLSVPQPGEDDRLSPVFTQFKKMRSAPEARAAACGFLLVGVKEPSPGIDFYPNCFSKLHTSGILWDFNRF